MHTTCGMAIIGFRPKYCCYCPNDKFYVPGCIMENKPCGLAPICCITACRKASGVLVVEEEEPLKTKLGVTACGPICYFCLPRLAGRAFCSPGPPRPPPTPFSHNSREKLTFVGIGSRPPPAGQQSSGVNDLVSTRSLLTQTRLGTEFKTLDPYRESALHGGALKVLRGDVAFESVKPPPASSAPVRTPWIMSGVAHPWSPPR
jgi:hypothetical protein